MADQFKKRHRSVLDMVGIKASPDSLSKRGRNIDNYYIQLRKGSQEAQSISAHDRLLHRA